MYSIIFTRDIFGIDIFLGWHGHRSSIGSLSAIFTFNLCVHTLSRLFLCVESMVSILKNNFFRLFGKITHKWPFLAISGHFRQFANKSRKKSNLVSYIFGKRASRRAKKCHAVCNESENWLSCIGLNHIIVEFWLKVFESLELFLCGGSLGVILQMCRKKCRCN